MKNIIQIIRYLVGIVFIISGAIKANDPQGLSYKMQEFFEAWNWTSLHDYTLPVAIAMNAFEVLAGIALLIGWRFRFISWLLLVLTVFFTFLTAYALFSGKIATCGCFGDCLPLQPVQSFIKDIVLLVLIVLLLTQRKYIQSWFGERGGTAVIIVCTVLVTGIQLYVLKHLPFVDCLPYKKGNNIIEKMQVPAGAVPDSFVITFRYKKDDKIVEFDADHFPDDFNEPPYEYIDRYDKLVRKGNAKPAIPDFNLQTVSGTDTTQAVLQQKGFYILVFAKDFSRIEQWKEAYEKVAAIAQNNQLPLFIVTADTEKAKAYFSNHQILRSDGTVIKTAARVNSTFVLMEGATIREKYSYADIDQFIHQLNQIR